MKKYILPICNISVAVLCGVVLFFSKLSDNTFYLMLITMIVGWVMPYIVLLVTGIEMLGMRHPKMALVYNVLGALMSVMDLIFVIRMLDSKMIVFLVEYILMGILSIINVVYFICYIKKHPNLENEKIKKIKKDNNGAIV